MLRFGAVFDRFGAVFDRKRRRDNRKRCRTDRKWGRFRSFRRDPRGLDLNYYYPNRDFSGFGCEVLLPRPADFWLGGQNHPQARPPNGRPQHLIEAAKRGRFNQMLFWGARSGILGI